MEVLVSGQAGAAASVTGQTAQVWLVGWPQPIRVAHRRVPELLQGCGDVQRVNVSGAQAAKAAAERAWASDRALWLTLMVLDPGHSKSQRQTCALALDPLINDPHVATWVAARMCSHPVAAFADLAATVALCADVPSVAGMLENLGGLQDAIARLRSAFDALPEGMFAEIGREQALSELVKANAFSTLAPKISAGDDPSFAILQIQGSIRAAAGLSDIFSQWLSAFRAGAAPRIRPAQVEADDSEWEDEEFEQAHGIDVFLNVRKQISEIIRRLRAGDESGARRFAEELISYQMGFGKPEYLAKTLCNLAQSAKRFGDPALHLEWSEEAVRVKPDDAWSNGQLADALITFDRFAEAEAALECVRIAHPSFAENMLARILRKTGQLEAALAAYTAVRAKYGNVEDDDHLWTGVAEVYRDMGDYEASLGEYEVAEARFPFSSGVLSGKAAVLSDLGRYAESIQIYDQAISNALEPLVPLNGRATAYRESGQLDKSLELYSQIVEKFPNEPSAYCGRAEVLRLKGDFPAAIAQYKAASQKFPKYAVAINGLANVMIDVGDLSSAAELISSTRQITAIDSIATLTEARLNRSRGAYANALALYEGLLARHPNDLQSKLGQANMYARLGNLDRALSISEEVLSIASHHKSALNLKASILIRMGEYDQAREELSNEQLDAESDWCAFLLRALIVARTSTLQEAIDILEKSYKKIPFARERRLVASALSILKLRQDRPIDTGELDAPVLGEVGVVVQLHVYAAARGDMARQLYHQLVKEAPAFYSDIRDEIAARYQLIDGGAAHSRDWLFEAETEMVLAEAA